MKAIVYYNESTIRCEEVPKPSLQDGEIIVRMRACGICGGDLMHWYRKQKAPLVLGHEVTGEVAEVAAGVESVAPGDRVFVHHHIACHTCHYCLHGDYVHCADFPRNRIEPGGFAEYIRVSAPIVRGEVLHLSERLSFEYGTLVEPLACCLKGLSRTSLRPGDTIGIIGAGPIGIMIAELARKTRGVGTVIISDTIESRRRHAKQYYADIAVDPIQTSFISVTKEATAGSGADAVIVTVSGSRAIQEGIEAVRNGGVVVIFAPPAPQDLLTVNPNALYFAEKQLVSSYTSSHVDTRQALRLLDSGVVDLQRIITHSYKLAQAEEAFRLAESREGMKVVITNA